ncbi:MAG: hypothetical protein J6Y02_09515 [Pseudobutyrivibrio sp.]|nr:hypothetical protein [Pseudobutyrivibrio sp.]
MKKNLFKAVTMGCAVIMAVAGFGFLVWTNAGRTEQVAMGGESYNDKDYETYLIDPKNAPDWLGITGTGLVRPNFWSGQTVSLISGPYVD